MKEHFLAILRNASTPLQGFREASDKLAAILAAEVSETIIPAPGEGIVICAILRAGLAILPPFIGLFPHARVGFFGMRREEKTASPRLYYENIPDISPKDHIILLDPMVATGGSTVLAIERLLKLGAAEDKVSLAGILCAPEGLRAAQSRLPAINPFFIQQDRGLDAKKYIVPGCGDYGDRYFGTA